MTAFVAGPYLDPKWLNGESVPAPGSATLRCRIVQSLKSLGVGIYLGEHQQLDKVSKAHLGGLHNAATAELLALEQSDAIVLLPSSTGSFCEFGAWAQMPHVCRKMLILLDKQYQPDQNYINLGVAPFAKKNGAVVHYIDYTDIDSAVAAAEHHVTESHARKRVQALVRGPE